MLSDCAILTGECGEIERLSVLSEIDCIEKPKVLYEGEVMISQGSLASRIQ